MKLSIITITYNAAECMARTMHSVLNQEPPVYEYVIVDGLSTDNTNEIIESFREAFVTRGIRFIHISEQDNGISDAFNKGIQTATGDVIGLINADDELMKGTNAILSDIYEESTDVYYGNCLWVDKVNGIKYERKAKSDIRNIRYEMVMIHPSTFVKAAAYQRYGLYDTTYRHCMDEELLTRFLEAGASFKYIDSQLTVFRAGGISDSGIRMTLQEGLRLAVSTEKPDYVRAYAGYICKMVRYYLSKLLKKCKLYRLIKSDIRAADD